MDWATFWQTFSQTHLVTLLSSDKKTLSKNTINNQNKHRISLESKIRFLPPKTVKLFFENMF
jgi:hypothetical protein